MSDRAIRQTPATFIDLCLQGDASVLEVDDYVERWHDGHDTRGLREFLGMSTEEYALWVEQPLSLRFIIRSHATGVPVSELAHLDTDAVGDRSSDPSGAASVLAWLRQTGRLDDSA